MKKKLTIGILAHVDAGKTTLSEAMLFAAGKLRKLGRVDHKNTFLDTNAIERERGITIFSKQARFTTEQCDFILLDTPGHVDFSAETERTLSLLDYAILVVSAPDGVQNHTRTLWQLLEFYQVPTFLFVNKTDISIRLRAEIEEELAARLSAHCIAFAENESAPELDEKLAMVHEAFLDDFLAGVPISDGDIASLVSERKLFPCFFGSALRMDGVSFLLQGLDRYTLSPVYDREHFGAKVYKIAHTAGTRLTYMKITGGTLTARDELTYVSLSGKSHTEKAGQLRLYSGDKFEQVTSVQAGEICAVIGLSATYVGQGFGTESDTAKPLLEPVLSYRIILPDGCDPVAYYPRLKELEEEDPSLHLYYNEELRQIEARLMGDIQIDLITRLIRERFAIDCTFGAGKILYKERISGVTIGVGHFEPLRHYAEVQLLMEPQPKGTGLVFDVRLPENSLDTNWQRLILSHLYEKTHRGTKIGAMLTDTKITLVAGKAHVKHTEGGDFREATLRAVRHGLMKAGCTLLEPYYRFRLELPITNVGRAMADLEARCAVFTQESADTELAVLVGRAPVSSLHDYPKELIAYTRGQGRLLCTFDGYEPCHNEQEIVDAVGYDPEADLDNPPHSVFCAHGAGFIVPWQEVDAHKHLDAEAMLRENEPDERLPSVTHLARRYQISDEEVEAIMMREFGPIRRKQYSEPKIIVSGKSERLPKKKTLPPQKKIMIIDGYNVIFSWESLKKHAKADLADARKELNDLLANYAAYTKTELVLVYDAYLVKDGMGSDTTQGNLRIVYTKHDQTADTFIEIMMSELGPSYHVRVVTGDRLLQNSAVTSGILRMTAAELSDEITRVDNEITEFARRLSERNNPAAVRPTIKRT
ncbi:MAG: NYN domain-containing protein [Clostridia bacterium]|nr:NYN domain-containing protein [Clostridia bacterium]